MITNALPDIPRSYTAICEWAACVVYIAVLFRRVPPRRSVVVSAIGLAALIAVQLFRRQHADRGFGSSACCSPSAACT